VPVVRLGAPLFLPWQQFKRNSTKTALQRRLKKQNTLQISPDDIVCLVVPPDKKENNILELHEHLKRIYPSRKDVVLVTTTIMTSDFIHGDV
jgi:hypothetical protein